MGFLKKTKVTSFARSKGVKNKSKFYRDAEKETREGLDDLAKRSKQKNIDESFAEDIIED